MSNIFLFNDLYFKSINHLKAMELRHLRYFIAVAEELNFTRAAERLHMAQPPLSQQIQHLEAQLGFQLFRRTKRRVQLTEAGRVFFEESQKILQQVDRAIQLGKQTSRGELGQLTVGFVSSSAHNVVPAILQAFRTRCPAVKLELHELTTNEQLQRLRFGQIDIGFVRPPIEEDGINSEIVFREPLIVALPETHPAADSRAFCGIARTFWRTVYLISAFPGSGTVRCDRQSLSASRF